MSREEKQRSVNAERYRERAGPPGEATASEANRPRAPQAKESASQDPDQTDDRKQDKDADLWWHFVVKLLLVAVILVAVFRFVLGVHIQRGNRMYPFLMDGDLTVTYKLEGYREGDVVAYRRPDTGQIAISRIAAIGPCEVQISDSGGLLVDGSPREESPFYSTVPLAEYGLNYPYQLSASGYFLLDDNRPIGSDSRAFGEVRKWELLGKVVYVFRRRGI